MTGTSAPQGQIYTYHAADALYGLSWSVREDRPYRFAVSSFIQSRENYIDVIKYDETADAITAQTNLRLSQPFPATKIMFLPHKATSNADLLASSSNCMRIWKLGQENVELHRILDANSTEVAPLTAFDWAPENAAKLATSSINSTVVVWDIEAGKSEAPISVHNQAVYDLSFGAEPLLATCSADGSARIVDIRDAQQCTVVYTHKGEGAELLRIGWNRQDPRYIATFAARSNTVHIVDVRVPGTAFMSLQSHTQPVNAFSLAPHSAQYICTGGDDQRALIWDLQKAVQGSRGLEPVLRYVASSEVVALEWSTLSQDHIAICYTNEAQMLRV